MQAGLILLPGLVVTMVAGLAVVPLVRRVSPRIVVAGGLLISAAGYVAVLLGAHQDVGGRARVGLRAAVAGHRCRRDDLQRRDHLQRAGRQGRRGVGDLGDRVRDRRGAGHRRARRDPHRVLQRAAWCCRPASARPTPPARPKPSVAQPQSRRTCRSRRPPNCSTSAQQAFGGGVGVTSVIAVVLMVAARRPGVGDAARQGAEADPAARRAACQQPVARDGLSPVEQRRLGSAKKSRSRRRIRPASTPPRTSTRCVSRRSRSTSHSDPAAPVFGSQQPNTTLATRA